MGSASPYRPLPRLQILGPLSDDCEEVLHDFHALVCDAALRMELHAL
jgi:hypothetical protein